MCILPTIAALARVNGVIAIVHEVIYGFLVHEVVSLRISLLLSRVDVRIFPDNALV
jgi:hypothetical protein